MTDAQWQCILAGNFFNIILAFFAATRLEGLDVAIVTCLVFISYGAAFLEGYTVSFTHAGNREPSELGWKFIRGFGFICIGATALAAFVTIRALWDQA